MCEVRVCEVRVSSVVAMGLRDGVTARWDVMRCL